jgi:parvulin-like peptidyl-prolyl isomerase
MGNDVYYGASFAAVAKKSSQGLNAEEGGLNDWTNQGSLVSKRLDDALFTIETGKLSQVIEDERGYHIIRVLERTEPGKLSFEEVQTAIREQIKQQKISKQYKEIAQEFKSGVKVWTVFDDDPVLAKFAGRANDAKRR